MDMMDIRRRMMGNTFPSNFIFKEGKGFRKDIEYFFGLQSSSLCYANDDLIHMEGLEDLSSSLYIGAGLAWQNGYLRGNVIDTKGFAKLKIDAYINADNTRDMYFAILNNAKLSQNVFAQVQNNDDDPYWQRNNGIYAAYKRARDISGSATTIGRYTAEFDIAGMDGIILSLWSPDLTSSTGRRIEIYNIWFE